MKSRTKLSNRGLGIGDITPTALIIVVFAMIAGVGVMILGNFKTTSDASLYTCGSGYDPVNGTCCLTGYFANASDTGRYVNSTQPVPNNVSTAAGTVSSTVNSTIDNAITGLTELTSWTTTIALVIAAVIIIGLVMLIRQQNI